MIKKFWNKLFSKPKDPAEILKITAVRGELTPGFVTVDLEVFDQDGNVLLYPTRTEAVKVSPKIRQTVNRVLAGVESENDREVFELFILSQV
jgi:hypothetical protein